MQSIADMTMTERLQVVGYRYFRLYKDGLHTGYKIHGINKNLYLGASAKYWATSKYNLLFDTQKEVTRAALMGVILKPVRTTNTKRKSV